MSGRLKPRKEDNKYIVQVLLPSARGTYFVNHVEEKLEKQVSAFMRELIFNYVESICTKKQYAELEVPVTLVYGECDWSSSRERSETRALMRPQHYVELENTGHFSFLEAPEKVSNIIKS